MSILAAATRSSFNAERQRANTASAMALAGMPMSSAFTLVHLPVPFWPAASSTTSTKKRVGLAGSRCLRMSAVISIRYEPSSFWFHSAKTSESRSGFMPPSAVSR